MIDANKVLRSIISSLNYEYNELKESCPELLEECKETLKEYTEALLLEAADKADVVDTLDNDGILEFKVKKSSITSIINDINFD